MLFNMCTERKHYPVSKRHVLLLHVKLQINIISTTRTSMARLLWLIRIVFRIFKNILEKFS